MIGLAHLVSEHRAEFEYDWRARFSRPLSCVGGSMTWGEAVRLTRVLLNDPSSQVFAARHKWDHPMTREGIVALDQFLIAQAAAGSKKPKPHPLTPWSANKERIGKTSLPAAEVLAILRPESAEHQPLDG